MCCVCPLSESSLVGRYTRYVRVYSRRRNINRYTYTLIYIMYITQTWCTTIQIIVFANRPRILRCTRAEFSFTIVDAVHFRSSVPLTILFHFSPTRSCSYYVLSISIKTRYTYLTEKIKPNTVFLEFTPTFSSIIFIVSSPHPLIPSSIVEQSDPFPLCN